VVDARTNSDSLISPVTITYFYWTCTIYKRDCND